MSKSKTGFRVKGLGFRTAGFRVQGLGSRSIVLFIFVFLYSLTPIPCLYAGVPPGINYQGRYVENNVPFTGNKSGCQFKIYDDPTSGTLRWSSPAVSLNFDKGLFNYVIACSTHDWRAYDSYLEVVIDGTTLSPRERLQASPYAFFSSSAAYSYDADKIDNIDSSALVQIAGNQTITGVKTFTSSVTVTASDGVRAPAFTVTGTGSGSLDIAEGAITDRKVTSADLLITSSFTFVGALVTMTDAAEWTDLSGMQATLDITTAPAVIIVNGSCNFDRTSAGYSNHRLAIEIDGTIVALNAFETGYDENNMTRHAVAVTGARRVTTTGAKIVKLKCATWGITEIYQRSMTAFWVGSP